MGFFDFLPYVGEDEGWWERALSLKPQDYGSRNWFWGRAKRTPKTSRAISQKPSTSTGGGYSPFQPKSMDFGQQFQNILGAIPPVGGMSSLRDFESSVNPAYDAAAARIQDKFRQAFAEIGKREAKGQELLGLLPGRIDKQFAEGKGQVTSFAGDAGELPEGYALPVSIEDVGFSAGETAAPFLSTLGTLQSERQADVPLLEAAQGQYLGAQRSVLAQQQAEALAEVEMRRQSAIADFVAQRNAQMAELEQNRQQMALGVLAPLIEQQAAQGQAYQRFGGPEGAIDYYRRGPGREEIDLAHGSYIADLAPEFASQWRGTDQYDALWQIAMQAEQAGENVLAKVQAEARKRRLPGIGSLVMYDYAVLSGGGG